MLRRNLTLFYSRLLNHSIAFNASLDDQEPDNSLGAQQLLGTHEGALATGLTEVFQLAMVAESESSYKSTSVHSIDASLPANQDTTPPSSPVVAAQISSKSSPERQVIDLTDDNSKSEIEKDTGSELPHESTNYHSSRCGAVKGAKTIRSSLPSGKFCFVLLDKGCSAEYFQTVNV
jgi:hypothetical protein